MLLTNFEEEKAKGKRGEKIVHSLLLSLGYEVEDVSEIREYRYKGDFIVNGLMIEVKNDERIGSTGRVLCEEEVYYKEDDRYCKGNMHCDSDIYVVVSEDTRKIYFFDFKVIQSLYKRLGDPKDIDHPQSITYARLLDLSFIRKHNGILGIVEY